MKNALRFRRFKGQQYIGSINEAFVCFSRAHSWRVYYRTVHRVPQLWQTATDRVTETTFVFLPKSTTSSFQKPNRIHAMISHHQPMKTQYAQPFLRFSFTSVTA
jgi:hypothetical protein